MGALEEAATAALTDSMGLRSGETVTIVVDAPKREIGLIMLQAAKDLGAEALMLEMSPRRNDGEEPPGPVAAAMRESHVAMLLTTRSLSHTRARRAATEAGARIASMPGVTAEMMGRSLRVDYERMAEICQDYAKLLSRAEKAQVITEAGTNLTLSLKGRHAFVDSGIYRSPGEFGNLPAGEVFIAPLEGAARGELVIDGSMAGVGLLKHPIKMLVEDGYVTDVEGGREARQLQEAIDRHGKKARNIAELGMGMNPSAILTGFVLEDEKILGSIHVALGDNASFGGQVEVPSHLDGVMMRPTLKLDGVVVLQEGRLLTL
jgi:leucyl aminopeptidase (aminopeptidase T)